MKAESHTRPGESTVVFQARKDRGDAAANLQAERASWHSPAMRQSMQRRPRGELSAADVRRIAQSLGRADFDPHQPLFDADSLVWRVNREAALLLGGGRALLMQIAHPLVAEGVARFSNFRGDPLSRLWRTLELTLTITFASATNAIRAVREIERAHGRVHGHLEEAVGPFPKGTEYRANDPELMFWVQATLIDSGLLVYEKFVGPLTRVEKEEYYRQTMVSARLMGISAKFIPPTFGDFERYMRAMLRSDVLTVGPAAREVADGVLYPSRPFGLSQVIFPARLLTFELVPPELRRSFDLPAFPFVGPTFDLLATASRFVLPWLPSALRSMPYTPTP